MLFITSQSQVNYRSSQLLALVTLFDDKYKPFYTELELIVTFPVRIYEGLRRATRKIQPTLTKLQWLKHTDKASLATTSNTLLKKTIGASELEYSSRPR